MITNQNQGEEVTIVSYFREHQRAAITYQAQEKYITQSTNNKQIV
jgi:hypothetical protein